MNFEEGLDSGLLRNANVAKKNAKNKNKLMSFFSIFSYHILYIDYFYLC